MNIHHLIQSAARIVAVSTSAILIPAALEAACNISINPINQQETYLCCGPTACCETVWDDTKLLVKRCF